MTLRRILAVPIAAAASLMLVSCALTGSVAAVGNVISAIADVAGRPANPAIDQTATVDTVGDQVVMRGTQGLIVAHNAYQASAAAATAYVRSGRATPAQLARIRQLNDRAIALLETADTGLTIAQRAAEVLNIVAELDVFSGRR